MARRAQHLRCSLCEKSEQAGNRLDNAKAGLAPRAFNFYFLILHASFARTAGVTADARESMTVGCKPIMQCSTHALRAVRGFFAQLSHQATSHGGHRPRCTHKAHKGLWLGQLSIFLKF